MHAKLHWIHLYPSESTAPFLIILRLPEGCIFVPLPVISSICSTSYDRSNSLVYDVCMHPYSPQRWKNNETINKQRVLLCIHDFLSFVKNFSVCSSIRELEKDTETYS